MVGGHLYVSSGYLKAVGYEIFGKHVPPEIAEKWTAQARLAPSVDIASSKIYRSILEACSKILDRVFYKYPNVNNHTQRTSKS